MHKRNYVSNFVEQVEVQSFLKPCGNQVKSKNLKYDSQSLHKVASKGSMVAHLRAEFTVRTW